eukprot:CAMPEP_0183345746 /NCGR_PEP_ID=MMETSP0164_2-20130417/11087_1 /TAXON_ID=221442 /ORGANISM="Coccolithus pelagicus ssp braarudi, Strain PLY182g" /LENGTH=125 /DNA_ID=CAMNT_0025516933 /DNA_START=125 /DNA_END=503 /DNA_ORIENTATION=+
MAARVEGRLSRRVPMDTRQAQHACDGALMLFTPMVHVFAGHRMNSTWSTCADAIPVDDMQVARLRAVRAQLILSESRRRRREHGMPCDGANHILHNGWPWGAGVCVGDVFVGLDTSGRGTFQVPA